MAQVSKDPLDVSSEFIESGKHYRRTNKKKGGPDSKDEKIKRLDEVYRLHFEYGYSARKISKLMKVNRNTINRDMDYWYNKIVLNHDYLNPEQYIIVNIERLDAQRTRLRERLDKAQNFQQMHTIEKMILAIDSKINNIHMKLGNSLIRIHKEKKDYLNDYLKSNGENGRYLNFFDRIYVSAKSYEKISKIIKDDKTSPRDLKD